MLWIQHPSGAMKKVGRNAMKLRKLSIANSNEIHVAVVLLSNKQANDRIKLNDGNKRNHYTIVVRNQNTERNQM